VLFAHVKAAHARLSFDIVVCLGADQMNRRQRYNDLTVFADPIAKRELFANSVRTPRFWRFLLTNSCGTPVT
jgi:hypothetical protein